MKDIIKKLQNSTYFSLLTEKEIEKIEVISKSREYPKNSMIFWQNEEIQYGFTIVTGVVKEFRKYSNNRTKTICYKKDCDMLCNLSYLMPQKYIVSTQTIIDTTVIYYPMKEFCSIINENHTFMEKLQIETFLRIERTFDEMGDMIFRNLNGNLARKLIDLADVFGLKKKNGIQIRIKISQQELADMLGTNRETICKAMNEFKDEGSIEVDKKVITIIDKDKLLKWD